MSAAYRTDSSSDKEHYDQPHYSTTGGAGELDRAATHVTDRAQDIDEGIDPVLLKRIKRRVDLRLVPILAALYSISLIDRTNLSLAYVAGMGRELGLLTGDAYSIATLIFFVPYIILEVPANVGIRKFGAAVWLGGACMLWGICTLGIGFVRNSGGLIGLRAAIGVFEAVLFPGAAYLLGCWNVRKEIQVRMSAFYLLSVLVGGLSSILAYGFTQMNGLGGLAGWRWIYVMEGIITVVIGLIGVVFVIDFPDSKKAGKLFSEEEREILKLRIQRDRADAEYDPLTLRKCASYAMDLKIWAFGFLFCATTLVSYAIAFFGPIIILGLGFTAANAQILAFPPYVAAFIVGLIEAVLSDKLRLRGPFFILNACISIVGCCLLAFTQPLGLRLFSLFLLCIGGNSNVPLVVGWMQSSISGQSKRAWASAIVVAMGGVGGIISSIVYKSSETPTYRTGVYATLAFQAAAILTAATLMLVFKRQNARARAGDIVIEGVQGFRYFY